MSTFTAVKFANSFVFSRCFLSSLSTASLVASAQVAWYSESSLSVDSCHSTTLFRFNHDTQLNAVTGSTTSSQDSFLLCHEPRTAAQPQNTKKHTNEEICILQCKELSVHMIIMWWSYRLKSFSYFCVLVFDLDLSVGHVTLTTPPKGAIMGNLSFVR